MICAESAHDFDEVPGVSAKSAGGYTGGVCFQGAFLGSVLG